MRGETCRMFLFLFGCSATCVAAEEPPSLDFIEFLGEWTDDYGVAIDFEMFEESPRVRAPQPADPKGRTQYGEKQQ